MELGPDQAATLTLRNRGGQAARNVQIQAGPVTFGAVTTDQVTARVEPELIQSVEPDDAVSITVSLEVDPRTPEGLYSAEITVRWRGQDAAGIPPGNQA